MPIGPLLLIPGAFRIRAVDVFEDAVQVTMPMPQLQAIVNDRAEGQVVVPLDRHEVLEVAPFAGLAAVAELRPHRVGALHLSAHTAAPAAAARQPPRASHLCAGPRVILTAFSPNSFVA